MECTPDAPYFRIFETLDPQNPRCELVWGPDLFLRGGEGEERKRSGDSCSTSVCSWNVNREETVILEVIKKE